MTTETDRFEKEAETRRARVDSTLNELRDRLSVGRIVDEVWDYVEARQGADMVKNLGRQVRDNPIALGLIGAGVVWLMSGERTDGRQSVGERGRDPVGDRWRRSLADAPDDRGRGPLGAAGSNGGNGIRSTGADGDDGKGLGDSVSEAAGHLRETVAATADQAAGSVSEAAGTVRDAAGRYGESAYDIARSPADAATEETRAAGRDLYRVVRKARRSFLDTLYEEPLIIGGVAVALGAAIAAALPATRQEDELLGRASDRVRDEALAYGQDAMARAGSVAEKAYEGARSEAKAKTAEDASTETVAEKVAGVAKSAGQAARKEAQKKDIV